MDDIRVVMSISPSYLDCALVTVWSMMKHLDQNRKIKLSVLHCNINEESINKFVGSLNLWNNLTVEFKSVVQYGRKYGFAEDQLASLPTCFPLLGDEIFPMDEKILSLDSDLVVQADISRLWDISIGDSLIAATIDVDFNGQFRGGNLFYRRYYRTAVPLSQPLKYIQAGVVLYNLRAFRERFARGFLFSEALTGKYRYDDQDVLNLFCQGQILNLDMRWNVLHDNLKYRVSYIVSLAEDKVQEQYLKSRSNPWIIHYAGSQKPWDDKTCDYASAFWDLAAETPVFENFNRRYINVNRTEDLKKNSIFRRVARFIRFCIRKIRLAVIM